MKFTDKGADFAATIFIVVSSFSSFIASLLLVVSVLIADKRQKQAYAGDVSAGAKLILPVYRPLFQGLAVLFLVLSVAQLITILHNYTIYQVYYVLQYHTMCLVTVYLICPVLLVQHSISKKVFYTTFCVLFIYFVILSILWGASVHEFDHFNAIATEIIQIIFSLVAFVPPFGLCFCILRRLIPSRVQLGSKSNRSSSEFLLLFCIIYFVLNMYQAVNSKWYSTETAFIMSLILVVITFAWNLFFAFSLHRSLLADTKYWRGIGTHNRGGLQSSVRVDSDGAVPKPTIDMSVANTHFQDMMANIGNMIIDFAYLEIKKKIGDGASAKVYSGVYKGQQVAVKVSTPAEITEDVIDVFVKEGLLSSSFQHKNVVRFDGLCVRPPQIAMVMELCSKGNLKSSLAKEKAYWTPLKRMEACLMACRGLAYVHAQGFIHRDLKTENFFLSEQYEVKLGDFGESSRIQTVESLQGRRMTILGTVSYMAPEIIAAAKFYTTAIDVYALGITFWEIATGVDAHDNKSQFEIYSSVGKGIRPDMSKVSDSYPAAFKDCIVEAWNQVAELRPTAAELATKLEAVILAQGGAIAAEEDESDQDGSSGIRATGIVRNFGNRMLQHIRSVKQGIGRGTSSTSLADALGTQHSPSPTSSPLARANSNRTNSLIATRPISSPPLESIDTESELSDTVTTSDSKSERPTLQSVFDSDTTDSALATASSAVSPLHTSEVEPRKSGEMSISAGIEPSISSDAIELRSTPSHSTAT